MASFDAVNYSLRPSKSIQRAIVFDGVRKLQSHLDLDQLIYVGFGSIWFTDFVMAHKLVGIEDMVSIEKHEVGFRRAVFNSPFATVDVKLGLSSTVLPSLYDDEGFRRRPWMIWLDYDSELGESLRDDARSVIENVPENSLLLLTFNGNEKNYGDPPDRPDRLRDLLGKVVPDELSKDACKGARMQETLANFAIAYMKSVAADHGAPWRFRPSFPSDLQGQHADGDCRWGLASPRRGGHCRGRCDKFGLAMLPGKAHHRSSPHNSRGGGFAIPTTARKRSISSPCTRVGF